MPISVQCPGCAKKLNARDEMAGKRVKCPSCGQVVVVPVPGPAAQPREISSLPGQSPPASEAAPTTFPVRQQHATDLDRSHSQLSTGASVLTDPYQPHGPGPAAAPAAPAAGAPPAGASRNLLFDEIGRGGMGAVYKGRDTELGRELAVKVLLEEHRDRPELVRRFVEEAQIAGQLQHPGVAPVYELGRFADDRPFFTMKLVKGHTLAELLRRRAADQPDLGRFLGIFAQVCQTMGYAHSKGVIHRDLKPSNVMVGNFGEVQVMDWGLAKVLFRARPQERAAQPDIEACPSIRTSGSGSTADESRTGSVAGTPGYMAPEQARGEVDLVDERADVFGLGAILCVILTRDPPFRGRANEVLRASEPGDLRDAFARLDGCGADEELVRLCKECLAAERESRPRDATVVAERVAAYQTAVQERLQQAELERAAAAARAAEERKRRRVTAALLGVSGVAALAVAGLVLGLRYSAGLDRAYRSEAAARAEAEEARQAEEQQRKQAEKARGVAEAAGQAEGIQRGKAEAAQRRAEVALTLLDRTVYRHSLFLADLALRENKIVLARQRLQECKPQLRAWEWHYLNSQCHPELFSIRGEWLAFSPDGARLAVAGVDGVHLSDVGTGKRVLVLQGVAKAGRPLFSPDGSRIAVPFGPRFRRGPGVVRLYDAGTGRQVATLQGPAAFGEPVFSPDGTRIAVEPGNEGGDGVVRIYDARTGQEVLGLKGPAGLGTPVFSPTGEHVAASPGLADRTRLVRIYDARTGRQVATLKGPATVGTPVFSPDGSRIVVRGLDQVARVFDARTGEETLALKLPRSARRGRGLAGPPAFSPDGAHIAAGGPDGVIRVHDARTGEETLALGGPSHLYHAVFSPDGMRLAVSSTPLGGDRVVRVYDVGTGEEVLSFWGGPAEPTAPIFSPDGARIAVEAPLMGKEGMVRVYDARRGPEAFVIKGQLGQIGLPSFSPDGGRVAMVWGDGLLRIYDVRTGQEAVPLRGSSQAGSTMFSPDGACVAAWGSDAVVSVFDARTGRQAFALRGPAGLGPPAFSPDGRRLAAWGGDGVLRLFDTGTGREVLAIKKPGGADFTLTRLVFSPDGRRVASEQDGAVAVYDVQAGRLALVLRGPARLGPPEFSPDGARVAAHGADGVVLLFDVQTGRQALVLKGPPRFGRSIPTLVFSPDGTRLAAMSRGGVIRVYDLRTGQHLFTIEGQASLGFATFSPDSTRIVVGSGLGTDRLGGMGRVYDAWTGQDLLALRGPKAFSRLWFSPDGKRLLTLSQEGIVLWEGPRNVEEQRGLKQARLHGGIAAWHRAQAEDGQRSQSWFSAAFHLRRLCASDPGVAGNHAALGQALLHLGQFAEAGTATRAAMNLLPEGAFQRSSLARQLRLCERGPVLEQKLPAILAGKAKPADDDERLLLADLCGRYRNRHAAALRFFREALAANAALAGDPRNGHRYNAARCAALVAAGQGEDAGKLDGAERARLRQQARDWLAADLAVWSRHANARDVGPNDLIQILAMLLIWQVDPVLAGLRDPAALARLPQAERDACWKLWQEVAAVCRKAVDPGSARAHHELGLALAKEGRLDEAIARYRKAIDLDPGHARTHANLGAALAQKGRLDEALEYLRKAVDLDPGNAESRYNLGVALEEAGQVAEAISHYRKAGSLAPKWAEPQFGQGLTSLRLGRFAEARDAFRRGLDLLPKSDSRRSLWTGQLKRCEQMLTAETKLPAVLAGKARPADEGERLLLADLCCRYRNRPGAALRLFREALAANAALANDPGNGHRYNAACCAVLVAGGKGEDAGKLDDRERARLRQQARDWLAADLAVWSRRADSKDAGLVARIHKTIQHWHTDADLAGVRDPEALVHLSEDERKACGKLWAEVEAVQKKVFEPSAAATQSNLGWALAQKGRLDEAIARYRQAIDLERNHAQAHDRLGLALGRQGKHREAEAAFRQAIRLRPHYPEAYHHLGISLGAQGRVKEAEAAYRTVVLLRPEGAEGHVVLGAALFQQGRFRDAQASLKKAVDLLPAGAARTSVRQVLRECERFERLDARLPAVLKGSDRPASAAEHLEFAHLCVLKKLYAAAVRFHRDAFDDAPNLADDLRLPLRYNAARCAALAAGGKGEDAGRLDDEERARLRRRARSWLAADLVLWTGLANSQDAGARELAQKTLQRWQSSPDLASVRDAEALAKLPEAEQKSWRKFWEQVEAVRKKAGGKP